MKKHLILFSLILFSNFIFAQNPFFVFFKTTDIDTASATINVDVKVKDYTDVYGAQLFMTWDSSVYFYDTIINVNPELKDFASYNKIQFAAENNLSSGWGDAYTATLEDSTTIFTVVLKVVGEPCDSTTLKVANLSGIRSSLATFDLNGEIIEEKIRYEGGFMMIPGGDCNTSSSINANILEKVNYLAYPNPVKDIINIDLKNGSLGEYNIIFYNPLGDIIYEEKITKRSYNYIYQHKITEELPGNLVFVKIIAPDNRITLKKLIF